MWWGISSLIALFAGGWIAGRISGMPRSTEGGMHGLLTWAVAMLALVYLLSSAPSSLMRGAAGVLGTAAKEGMQSIGVSIDDINREARAVLAQTGKPDLFTPLARAPRIWSTRGARTSTKAACLRSRLSARIA